MQVDVRPSAPGTLAIAVSGEIDMACAERLSGRVMAMCAEADVYDVRLDLVEVGFLDSAGIKALLAIRRYVMDRDGTVGISRVSATVRRVLDVAGLMPILGCTGVVGVS
jgi:anti-sigma B factor antagonist